MENFVLFLGERLNGMIVQYKSVIAWDLGLEQIHPISDFAL